MATRRETQEKRAALMRDVLEAQRASGWEGGVAPSQRELSARYGLSLRTVSLEMRKLADEGLLDVKPRVGTFAGRSSRAGTYGFVLPYPLSNNVQLALAHYGFESRVAERGGACLTASAQEAGDRCSRGEWAADGAFAFEASRLPAGFAAPGGRLVAYDAEAAPTSDGCDRVGIDNFDGGRVAARRLLESGHTRIAFLGLHCGEAAPYAWSQARADGWRQALREAGLDPSGLSFEPERALAQSRDQEKRGESGARRLLPLLRSGEVSAVVSANAHATTALLRTLRGVGFGADRWPAIVSFDDAFPDGDSHIVSALRLPWEAIGRQAADLLWERATGRLAGPPVCRLAKMTLIPRLTCGPKPRRS